MQANPKLKEEPVAEPLVIKNVWKYNCEKEFLRINELLEQGFTFVAMDTEFPGFLFDGGGKEINAETIYQVVKMNVDHLNPIQVGMTFSDIKGNKPEGVNTWQFNLGFNIQTEQFSQDSINILSEAGINFQDMAEHGIDHMVFGDFLMSSGLVVNPEVQWITFHGCYDFAYLIKLLRNEHLPPTSPDFMKYLQHLFPVIWDVKVLINDFDEWKKASLSGLAVKLDLKRSGITHQAGSDALLTANVFYKIMQLKFPNGFPESACNKVFGLSFGISLQSGSYSTDVMNGQYYPYTGGFVYPYDQVYQYNQYTLNAQMGHEYYYPQHGMMPQMMAPRFVSAFPAAPQPKHNKKK
jgi:CCR4-NOT transcription complex subunit 7/8